MNELIEKIRAEIISRGAIPFDRFMELALYCPVYGYYEKEEDKLGRAGDFFTSISVGKLFGELLAFQFADWLAHLQKTHQPPTPALIVEAGAHNAQLAKDILSWLNTCRPELFSQLSYWIIEPSTRRRAAQQKTLAQFEGRVRWFCAFPADEAISGVIFSNELLDAMPVRRLGWDARPQTWFEWGVTTSDTGFAWTKLPFAGSSLLPALASDLLRILPDEFTVEISPAAASWWASAARFLRSGKLLTFDYGFASEELISPSRPAGTLRAYRNHRLIPDVLADPGQQDITAHIDFNAIQAAGETAGLQTESFMTQEAFLTSIASQTWNRPASFPAWTPEMSRQFQTLTHPAQLGHRFRVLIQTRLTAS